MTTTLRLIRDVVTRGRLAFACGAVMVFLLTLLSESVVSRETTAAWLMMVSAYVALGVPLFLLSQREIAQFPVTRLELWRSRIAIAVGFSLAVGLPATLAAIALRTHSSRPPSADAVLSSLVDLTFSLSLLGFAAAWPVDIVPYDPKHRRLGIIGMATFVVLYFSPLMFRTLLPLSWSQISPASAALMGVLAALGIKALTYQPAATPRAGRRHMPSGIKKTPLSSRFGNSLTGLSRLFWVHTRQIALQAPLAFGMIWFIEVVTRDGRTGSVRDLFHVMQLMPFDVDYAGDGRHGFNLLMFIFAAAGDKPRELMQRARALRVMPMTANHLSLMFAALAVVEAGVIWLWMLGVHVAITGSLPGTLRPEVFILFCGALTLARSIESLFLSSGGGRIVGMILLTPVFFATMRMESAQPLMAAAGLAALAGGVVLQAYLFRRRQKLYKFKPPTFFGKPLPS